MAVSKCGAYVPSSACAFEHLAPHVPSASMAAAESADASEGVMRTERRTFSATERRIWGVGDDTAASSASSQRRRARQQATTRMQQTGHKAAPSAMTTLRGSGSFIQSTASWSVSCASSVPSISTDGAAGGALVQPCGSATSMSMSVIVSPWPSSSLVNSRCAALGWSTSTSCAAVCIGVGVIKHVMGGVLCKRPCFPLLTQSISVTTSSTPA